MVFACHHASLSLARRIGRATTERRLKANLGSRRGRNGGGKGQSSGVPVEDREEGEGGKPHGEDVVVGWGEGWPSELECEARHLSRAPGESTNGGIKKNHELHVLIPTADLAAVCGTVCGERGGGETAPTPAVLCELQHKRHSLPIPEHVFPLPGERKGMGHTSSAETRVQARDTGWGPPQGAYCKARAARSSIS